MAILYDNTLPLDTEWISLLPQWIRDKGEQLRADSDPIVSGQPIVNAKKLQGYLAGNSTGQIPISNGTLCTNLNAQMLNGHTYDWYAPASHIGTNGSSHTVADSTNAGFMPNTHFTKVADIIANPNNYANYNAFQIVKVGATNIVADSFGDTFEISASSWFTLTPDATNDKVTIDLVKDGSGNANHPHAVATSSANGFMSTTQVSNLTDAYSHISNTTAHYNFGKITVGGKTLIADANQDVLTISAGTGITLTSDDTTDTFTISITQDGHTHALSTASTNGFMSSTQFSQLANAVTHYALNHNNFGNILVGSTTIASDALNDTLEIVQGTGITLTPDATNDKLTIALSATANADTVDTYHAGNSSGQIPVSNGTLCTNLNAQKLNGLTSGQFLRLDSNNANITGALVFDVASERTVRANGTNISWGLFLNNTGCGLYDWQNGRGFLVYTASTNTVACNSASWTFGVAPSSPSFISTVPTGTAPFTVASTTTVNNLSAQYLSGLGKSGFVLVDGSQAMTGNLSLTNSNAIRFWDTSGGYQISMVSGASGGRVSTETTSDYNMYLKMTGGTNRGFVFLNGTTPTVQIDGIGTVHAENGFRTKKYSIQYNATEDSLDFIYNG